MSEDKKNNLPDVRIKICCWNQCKEKMSQYTLDRACRELNLKEWTFENWWITDNWMVEILKTWCMGNCKNWPSIKIEKIWKSEQMIWKVDPIKMWNIMNEFKKFKNID